MKTSSLCVGLSAALACAAATDGSAQEATAPGGAALETIVVTAQKRREDVKEVPLSVSAISGEALHDNQVADFTDLSRIVPNVSFMSQAGSGLSTLEIRGVTSQAGSATVGVYLDDVSLTTRNLYSQGTAEPRFFDINRVEVLRGPQGTLYGAGSMGGTIRFISNQPDPAAFSASGAAQVSHTEHGGFNDEAHAVLNVPLSSTAAIRVGMQQGHDSGYIDQVSYQTLQTIQKGINSTNWTVEKAALKAQIAPGWSITPAVFAQQYRSSDIDGAYLNVPTSQVGNGQTGVPGPALGLFQTSKTLREPGDDRLAVYSLNANGDLQFGDLTAILSNYRRNFNRIQDGTFVNSNYIASQINSATYPGLVQTVNYLNSPVFLGNNINSTSLELRVASKDYEATHDTLTWVAGTYLSRTKTNVADNEPVLGIAAAFQAAGADITDPAVLAGAYPNDFGPWPGGTTNDNSYFSARHYVDTQKSVFGELTAHFGPSLRAIAGLRWLTATEDFHREGEWYFTGTPGESISAVTAKSTAMTPRFAVDWDIDASNTAYANIAKGFRVGGANRPIPTVCLNGATEPVGFDPDSLWSYELGLKSLLLDRRLSVDVAAYHIDWKNIQQDLSAGCGFDYETNVGKATGDGIEFDARWRVLQPLTVSAGGNWTRAVFAEDIPALGATAGQWIQGVPRYTLHLGVEDHFKLAADLDAVARLNGNWTGRSYGTWVTTSADYNRPQYFTADASGGVAVGRLEFGIFVKNLTNNHTVLQQMPIQFLNEAVYLRPRTIGVSVSGEI